MIPKCKKLTLKSQNNLIYAQDRNAEAQNQFAEGHMYSELPPSSHSGPNPTISNQKLTPRDLKSPPPRGKKKKPSLGPKSTP